MTAGLTPGFNFLFIAVYFWLLTELTAHAEPRRALCVSNQKAKEKESKQGFWEKYDPKDEGGDLYP